MKFRYNKDEFESLICEARKSIKIINKYHREKLSIIINEIVYFLSTRSKTICWGLFGTKRYSKEEAFDLIRTKYENSNKNYVYCSPPPWNLSDPKSVLAISEYSLNYVRLVKNWCKYAKHYPYDHLEAKIDFLVEHIQYFNFYYRSCFQELAVNKSMLQNVDSIHVDSNVIKAIDNINTLAREIQCEL